LRRFARPNGESVSCPRTWVCGSAACVRNPSRGLSGPHDLGNPILLSTTSGRSCWRCGDLQRRSCRRSSSSNESVCWCRLHHTQKSFNLLCTTLRVRVCDVRGPVHGRGCGVWLRLCDATKHVDVVYCSMARACIEELVIVVGCHPGIDGRSERSSLP
jgi:hypothetical protein